MLCSLAGTIISASLDFDLRVANLSALILSLIRT